MYVTKFSDQPTLTGSVSIINTTLNVIEISWEQVSYENCAANSTRLVYNVTVTAANGNVEGDIEMTGETSAVIHYLKANQKYAASVTAVMVYKADNYTLNCDTASYPILRFSTSNGGEPHGMYNHARLSVGSSRTDNSSMSSYFINNYYASQLGMLQGS